MELNVFDLQQTFAQESSFAYQCIGGQGRLGVSFYQSIFLCLRNMLSIPVGGIALLPLAGTCVVPVGLSCHLSYNFFSARVGDCIN